MLLYKVTKLYTDKSFYAPFKSIISIMPSTCRAIIRLPLENFHVHTWRHCSTNMAAAERTLESLSNRLLDLEGMIAERNISIFHGIEVRIDISVPRDNCVWRIKRLRRVPAKTVIPRDGNVYAHRKTHERYFFFNKTLISLFFIIFY